MNIDNTLYTGRPTDQRSDVEMAIYDKLEALGMDYKRADHDHADTMEDCLAIEKVLGAKICKNLFLCNRQKTSFYMLLMPGDKPFKTKFLTSQLNCARLSFAEADKMQEYLHTIGAYDYFSAMVCGDMITNGKPAPDIYLTAAKELGLPPQVCAAFEDSPNGITAAHAAGCHAIMIPDMTQPDDEIRPKLSAVYESLDMAIEYFEREE